MLLTAACLRACLAQRGSKWRQRCCPVGRWETWRGRTRALGLSRIDFERHCLRGFVEAAHRYPPHSSHATSTIAGVDLRCCRSSRVDTIAFQDRELDGGRGPDSQDDSHSVGQWQPSANVSGLRLPTFDLGQTSLDVGGCQKRGLQNRLGSSVDVRLSSLTTAYVRRRCA